MQQNTERVSGCLHLNFEGFKDDHNEDYSASGIATTKLATGSPKFKN
jgi:hypothetical protein